MKKALIELESRRVIEKMKRFKNAEQLSNDYILLHPDEWIKTLEGVGQAVADVGRAVTEGRSQDGPLVGHAVTEGGSQEGYKQDSSEQDSKLNKTPIEQNFWEQKRRVQGERPRFLYKPRI